MKKIHDSMGKTTVTEREFKQCVRSTSVEIKRLLSLLKKDFMENDEIVEDVFEHLLEAANHFDAFYEENKEYWRKA